MEENVKSFLDKIQELKEVKSKVSVLSTGKEIECSPLTFKQQKDLIGTIADGSVGSLKFNRICNDIIITNTGSQDIRVSDKLPILLKLRIDSIGKIYKFGDNEVDLEEVLERAKKLKLRTHKIMGDKIKVELDAPILTQENKVIQTLKSYRLCSDGHFDKYEWSSKS